MTKEQMDLAYEIATEQSNVNNATPRELVNIGFQMAVNGEVLLDKDNRLVVID